MRTLELAIIALLLAVLAVELYKTFRKKENMSSPELTLQQQQWLQQDEQAAVKYWKEQTNGPQVRMSLG